MHEQQLLKDIGLAVISATLLGVPFHKLKFPLLLAYLAAGVVLGPHLGFGFISNHESIATLSSIGLILLMFILGLEIEVPKLLRTGPTVLVTGAVQVVTCALLGLAFFWLTGYRGQLGEFDWIYLGFACAMSSTLIVVKILSDNLLLSSMASRITLGILVMQDLMAIGFLAVQPNLNDLHVSALAMSVTRAAALIGFASFAARFLLPWILKRVAHHPELLLLTAMSWCFSMCAAAEHLHLSMEMGALIAGISIASYPYHFDIAAKLGSLRDFFITLFFVSLGLQIPHPTAQILSLTSLIIVFVLVSRFATMFPTLYFMKHGNRASFVPSLNLSQLSEFALVLGALGVAYGHIHEDVLSAMVLATVLTALLSSLVIPKAHSVFHAVNPWLQRLGFKDQILHHMTEEDSNAPAEIVLLGFYREASSLLSELRRCFTSEMLKEIMVVDFNPEAHRELKRLGIRCKYGDVSNLDILTQLRLDQSRMILCTVPDYCLRGTSNLMLLSIIRRLAPNAKVLVTAETIASAREMYEKGADFVFLPRMISAQHLAEVIERLKTGEDAPMREYAREILGQWQEILP
jgi:Kef-type K+ transport system membrane component KefB